MDAFPPPRDAPLRRLRPSRSLSLKLLLWLCGVAIVAFTGYTAFTVRTTSEQWAATVEACSRRFSDLVRRSTHHAMLVNRKEDVHHIIRTVAREDGVVGVRIYDKDGTVRFSGREDDLGTSVDIHAEACIVCHAEGEPLRSVPDRGRVRVFEAADGHRVLGLIAPIQNLPECAGEACHPSPDTVSVLGVLDVQMSMAGADALLATTRRHTIIAALAMTLLVGLASAAFLRKVVGRPVRKLTEGAVRVSRGDLDARIEVDSNDEIGRLAGAFNTMTEDLGHARDELTEWSRTLERKVVEKTEELGRTQRQVVHMEKMASLGTLSATVAHELNNPLAGILNYSKLVERDLGTVDIPDETKAEMLRCLDLVQKEASRSGDIVRNLLRFARPSGGEFALHAARGIVDRAVMLVRHHVEMSGVELEVDTGSGNDELVCDPDQVQQALVALMVNAVEAMPDGGALSVRTLFTDGEVRFEIQDSGIGIPPGDIPHLFEPFFSTKKSSSGVGLGLAVVYGIVQRHTGTIDVRSTPGQGTTFVMTLPRRPARVPDPAEDDVTPALAD